MKMREEKVSGSSIFFIPFGSFLFADLLEHDWTIIDLSY
jgi:hypothetical protein